MRLQMTCFSLILLLVAGCQVTPEREENRTLNAGEVQALFSGKTVEALNLITGKTSIIYYSPEGGLLLESNWEQKPGLWTVEDSGEICLQIENTDSKCRSIALINGRYYKQRPNGNGGQELIIRYRRFADGNELAPGSY